MKKTGPSKGEYDVRGKSHPDQGADPAQQRKGRRQSGSDHRRNTKSKPEAAGRTEARPRSRPEPARRASADTAPSDDERTTRIEVWPLSRLRQHPRQDSNFHPLSQAELDRLVESIDQNGLISPIEALPDGTVLDGHQRLRALTRLGWSEVPVLVREDLADDPMAAERRAIDANRDRRQLGVLDQARLAKRLLELARRRPDGLAGWERGDLRDRVGRVLGLSGRHVSRLLLVLEAPMPVQRAVDAGKLTLVMAGRVAGLDMAVQEAIAGEIAAGGDPAAVVAARLPKTIPRPANAGKALRRFCRAGEEALATLAGREREVRLPGFGPANKKVIDVLERVGKMIGRIVARLESLRKGEAEMFKDLAKSLRPKRRRGPGPR
jgi:ParB/RepB/Spo0J family partition protein